MKTLEGGLVAKDLKFTLVVSRFNDFLTGKLLEGALDTLKRHGVEEKDMTVIKVPGSFELPLACDKAAEGKCDAVIALGAVIRGDTPHFDFVAQQTSKGLAEVSLKRGIPVVFGVVMADTLEQAVERCGTKQGNKGSEAARTAIESANLFKKL
ncbi:MAG TPA: 6,7-dimethyl-8-ribityllumazine synthase [Elusimicrobia bacterium]|nr:6,7-dimethyl-8-ribityllumazine synthase [Elusimicrobiota bacterium]